MVNLREAWTTLATTPGQGAAGYAMRLVHASPSVRIYAAVSQPRLHPAVVIEIPDQYRPRDFSVLSTRAVNAIVAVFPGLPPGHIGLTIQLRDEAYEDLFLLLGQDIVSSAAGGTSPSDAIRRTIRCLGRWRRFVERDRGLMSGERVRGLIGELTILARCITRVGSRAALTAWTGPADALRDFQLPDISVEVKTFESDTGASVRISDPQQLEDDPVRPVYLAAVRLGRSETTGRTLPELIALIVPVFADEPDVSDLFDERVAEYGYLPVHADQYMDRFVIDRCFVYRIAAGFPRIRSSDVPPGITGVHFSVMLSAIGTYEVDPAVLGRPAVPSLEHAA